MLRKIRTRLFNIRHRKWLKKLKSWNIFEKVWQDGVFVWRCRCWSTRCWSAGGRGGCEARARGSCSESNPEKKLIEIRKIGILKGQVIFVRPINIILKQPNFDLAFTSLATSCHYIDEFRRYGGPKLYHHTPFLFNNFARHHF